MGLPSPSLSPEVALPGLLVPSTWVTPYRRYHAQHPGPHSPGKHPNSITFTGPQCTRLESDSATSPDSRGAHVTQGGPIQVNPGNLTGTRREEILAQGLPSWGTRAGSYCGHLCQH